jgi:hypothetical protein
MHPHCHGFNYYRVAHKSDSFLVLVRVTSMRFIFKNYWAQRQAHVDAFHILKLVSTSCICPTKVQILASTIHVLSLSYLKQFPSWNAVVPNTTKFIRIFTSGFIKIWRCDDSQPMILFTFWNGKTLCKSCETTVIISMRDSDPFDPSQYLSGEISTHSSKKNETFITLCWYRHTTVFYRSEQYRKLEFLSPFSQGVVVLKV